MLTANEKKLMDEEMRHPCKLPETEDILVHYIDSGYFVDLRRRLKRLTMCNENSLRTQLYLLSTSSINWEKSNHLRYYFGMIHPFSTFRLLWEIFICVVFLVLLVWIPIRIFVVRSAIGAAARALLDVLGIVDIVLTFRTGFQHDVTKNVIMNPAEVAKKYLRTWFVLDVLAVINSDPLTLMLPIRPQNAWKVRLVEIFRIFRLFTLSRYLERIREWTQVNVFKFNLIKVVVVVGLVILWNTCALFATAQLYEETWFTIALTKRMAFQTCLLRIVEMFLLVKHGGVDSRSGYLFFAEIVWLTFGVMLKLLITGLFVQIVLKQTSLSDKYYGIMQQFSEYMDSKNLPDRIRKRVLNYFQFRFNRNFFKESEILGNLSKQMRQEIIFHTRRELLIKSSMFSDLPDSLLLRIGRVMRQEIFLPNDVVVTSGHHADVMYFIVSGMVAIYNTQGKEVCHLGDGSYFGEAALFSNDRVRLATVVAIDFCEMYTLPQGAFSRTVAPYPDLLERILKICNDRLKKFVEEENVRFEKGVKETWNDTRLYYNI